MAASLRSRLRAGAVPPFDGQASWLPRACQAAKRPAGRYAACCAFTTWRQLCSSGSV
jgi:hypothetical protein